MASNPHRGRSLDAEGSVRNPQGERMMEAARKELSDVDFNALMQETGGQPPTPAQLVNLVEARRHVAQP